MAKTSTWTALRNPVFRNMWLASLISGTCVAAQDTAATWAMNRVSDSPLFVSLSDVNGSLAAILLFHVTRWRSRRHAGPQANDVCHDRLVSAYGGGGCPHLFA